MGRGATSITVSSILKVDMGYCPKKKRGGEVRSNGLIDMTEGENRQDYTADVGR